MTVGSHCRRPAATTAAGETLRGVAERMDKERVGSLVIVEGRAPLGIVTDRDIALRVLADGVDADATAVGEVASRPAVTLAEDLPLKEAGALMRGHGLRRIPIVDAAGDVVGILSADDLLRLLALELTALADVATEQVPLAPRSVGEPQRAVEHYTKEVTTIGSEARAAEVARLMRSEAVGCIVVVDPEGTPRGVVTDRDLTLRVIARGLDPASTPASSFMSQAPICMEATERLQIVAAAMSENAVRRILVTRDGQLVGIVTYDDLVVAVGGELHDLGEAARHAIARERAAAQHPY